MKDNLLIGMHCGARGDSVSAALVNSHHGSLELMHAARTPYPAAIRQTLIQVQESTEMPDPGVKNLLDETLGRYFARVAQNLAREAGMEMRDILAIGFDGQETWHTDDHEEPVGVRLGSGRLLAKNTGTTVVGHLHGTDIKADGQGQPLSALFHHHMFYNPDENRAVLDISSSTGLTMLSLGSNISAIQCGPGNCLLDAWAERHLGEVADLQGTWARKGRYDHHLLERLLDDPIFSPGSGVSTMNKSLALQMLDKILAQSSVLPVDVQATLNEFIARRVAISLDGRVLPRRLLVCGPGAENLFLMRRIAALIPDTVVETTSRYGAEPGWVDCMSLAWLAEGRLAENCHDTQRLIGANRPVLPGQVYLSHAK